MNRPELIQRQNALDRLGEQLCWTRGPYRSWKVKGYTIALGGKGWPRPYVAVKDGKVREFRDLGDLQELVLAAPTRTSRRHL